MFTTKTTAMPGFWYCQVSFKGKPIVQAKAYRRCDIGPTFRDLLRTLDKCNGDEFTNAARYRQFSEKNAGLALSVKHEWL